MAIRYVVDRVAQLPAGTVRIVQVAGRSIGVFNVSGTFYAIKNTCPHNGAPLCKGNIGGTNLPSRPGEYLYGRPGEIVRCPWHGWEFSIRTGTSVFNPHELRVKTFPVSVEKGAANVSTEEVASVESFEVSVEEDWVILHV